jgi:hydroxymethylpyrimidine pyrophosphatase-like HAD family hydrolase
MKGSVAMKPRFCIVSDLDHTMVDHHDTQFTSLLGFNRMWASKFAHDSLLVFSTGRSLELYKQLRTEAPMLTPDLLICSVGTEIYHTRDRPRAGWRVASRTGELGPETDHQHRGRIQ